LSCCFDIFCALFPTILKVELLFIMDAQILATAKVLPNATKIEPFNGNNFKRWQQKVLATLDFTKISCALHEPKPDVESGEKAGEKSKKLENWKNG
jgi:hypothetical protein